MESKAQLMIPVEGYRSVVLCQPKVYCKVEGAASFQVDTNESQDRRPHWRSIAWKINIAISNESSPFRRY